ncbi:VanZ family protein [Actinacidiphila glaucinigra]|uniref:VanZ family protein n=1 Tax=Actinacidiphila glaucinigra TaxID=235986 RepID=UPI00396AAE5C
MYLRLQVANALMFTVLAVLLRFSFPAATSKTIAVGSFAASVCIESFQWLMNAGRVVDIDDVMLNTIGACAGLIICQVAAVINSRGYRTMSRMRVRTVRTTTASTRNGHRTADRSPPGTTPATTTAVPARAPSPVGPPTSPNSPRPANARSAPPTSTPSSGGISPATSGSTRC